MKKTTLYFLIIGLLLSFQAQAQPQLSEVKVVTSVYKPYSYAEDGAAQGIAVNAARQIFSELDFFPPINVYPWARTYNIALNTPNTLIFSMARTPEREDKFHWIGPIVGFDIHLFKHQERDDIQVNNMFELKRYHIGALRKDVKGQYLRKQGIEVTDINSEETGIKLLLTHRLDLMPADIHATRYRLREMGLNPNELKSVFHLKEISRPLYIAFNKKTPPELVALFREAYKKAFPGRLPLTD